MLEALVHIKLTDEAVAEADLLNGEVAPDQLKLLLKRDVLAAGDARAQQRGEVGGQLRHLRHAAGHAQPLHAVERVVEKVRVELGLEHPQARFVQLALALHAALKVLAVLRRHAVEARREAAHFILPCAFDAHIVIAALDAAHRAVELVDRLKETAAEPPGAHETEHQTQRAHQRGDEVDRPDDLRGIGLRLLQDERKAAFRAGADVVAALAVPVGERFAGEQLRAQQGKGIVGAQGLGGVEQPPRRIDEQQIVRTAQQGREEGVEVGVVHAEHGIAEHRTAARGHGTGSGKPAVSGAQHNAVRRAGRAEYAPAGALRGGPYVRRGIEAVAVLAVDLKVGVFAQRDRAAVQKLIERARVTAAAAQGAARHGAAGQGARDVAAVGKQRVELRGEQRHLLLRVGTQGVLAAEDHHLRHQHVAQQQRHERDEQDGEKNAVSEGPLKPCSHASTSPHSACQASKSSCRRSSARRRS